MRDSKIHYDSKHDICQKYVVYFTSRFGIVYSPFKNLQTFYQGHSLKISCIQKHPFRSIVATGEVCAQPKIHIWDAQTLEPLMVLNSAH
jgi:microtubule-associated protein-like 6